MPLNSRVVSTNGVGGETGYDWTTVTYHLSPSLPVLHHNTEWRACAMRVRNQIALAH